MTLPTVKISGRDYVLVKDRILAFNELYPTGSITTELVSYENKQVIIKATVKPEKESDRIFTGYSQAIEGEGYINKTSALENCETSAVGRALAMMGIGVIDSVASVDEINKAQRQTAPQTPTTAKNLLWVKIKKYAETKNIDPNKENIMLSIIADKTGADIKSKAEIDEVLAKNLIDMWTN
jgi:hypothetical protein